MPTERDALMVSLLFHAGLRPGEAYALTWGSVGPVLIVDRSFSAGQLRGTKTNRRRTVEVVQPLAEDLDDVRPAAADPQDLVIRGRNRQPLDGHNWRQRVWTPACERARLKAAPYDGRHTYASLLIHEGRALPYVTAALGHASASTTLNNYAHLFDAARLETGIGMEDAIFRAREQIEDAPPLPRAPDDVRDMFALPEEHSAARLPKSLTSREKRRAGDRARTGDIQLGKLTLYQLSYTRVVV